MNKLSELITFEKETIRKIWYKDEWYFSVVDIIAILTDSKRPRKYWADLKKKLIEEGFELSDNFGQLRLQSKDGKTYVTDCVSNKGAFRLIQSIPSKKAEPLKLWLAQLGEDRINEIQNPELGVQRSLDYYKKKGYSEEWIKKREFSIITRKKLTTEWKNRGINENKDFALLTNIIHTGTFDISVQGHKNHKSISKKEELRDHMTDIELALISLSEATTTEISKIENSYGLDKLSKDAKEGSHIGKSARITIEKRLKKGVISKSNFLEDNK